ncbi:MAG: phosphotransferase [Alphaproteobacteria bacterium]|nr:phosphotransferase [Alphaproteobacteria bacterium]
MADAAAQAERAKRMQAFLLRTGWGAAERAPLAGDASFRRYLRLRDDEGGTAVLMDAPPPKEDIRPFLAMTRLLLAFGYSAPRIIASDPSAGLLLIEDLGDETYTRTLARGEASEEALYALAVDLLIDLHKRFRPSDAAAVTPAPPPYNESRLLAESDLFVTWYLPAREGRPAPAQTDGGFGAAVTASLAQVVSTLEPTLVLRDFHVDNLMWLKDRGGLKACGLLDYQDAVIGSPAYDLVSLLEDARRDVPAPLQQAMINRYLKAFPDIDPKAFRAAYAVLGAQRNLKIIGIFTRLSRRDGKSQYLPHIARVWRLLEGDLRHPACEPIRDWLDSAVPPQTRTVPS